MSQVDIARSEINAKIKEIVFNAVEHTKNITAIDKGVITKIAGTKKNIRTGLSKKYTGAPLENLIEQVKKMGSRSGWDATKRDRSAALVRTLAKSVKAGLNPNKIYHLVR